MADFKYHPDQMFGCQKCGIHYMKGYFCSRCGKDYEKEAPFESFERCKCPDCIKAKCPECFGNGDEKTISKDELKTSISLRSKSLDELDTRLF